MIVVAHLTLILEIILMPKPTRRITMEIEEIYINKYNSFRNCGGADKFILRSFRKCTLSRGAITGSDL